MHASFGTEKERNVEVYRKFSAHSYSDAVHITTLCLYKGVGKGEWGGGAFKLVLLYVQAVTAKRRPKKTQLSGYKQCYTYKNQSLEVSKYMNLALITCNKLDPRG